MEFKNPNKEDLFFIPLSGTREIGKNLNLYGHNGKWLMVDCGVKFGHRLYPYVDVVMPHLATLDMLKENIEGLVITHAHEDHLGALPYLPDPLPFPIYATDFAYEIIKNKLDKRFSLFDVRKVKAGSEFKVGGFDVEFVHLTHSTVESQGVLIKTPVGKIFHTGDWKFDKDPVVGNSFDEERLKALAQEDVLAVVCDSTNALVPGSSISEGEVKESISELISPIKGRIILTCFSSNIARLESIIMSAHKQGRKIAVMGRSIERMIKSAQSVGYLQSIPALLTLDALKKLPQDEQFIICTGSQGERRAALKTIVDGANKHIKLSAQDTVIFSSRTIPGNELDIFALQNRILDLGASLITPHDCKNIHTSGHATQDDLRNMYSYVKPRYSIPVHGELKHMQAHADIAYDTGVEKSFLLRNGECLSLNGEEPQVIFSVENYDYIMDGNRAIDMRTPYISERRKVAGEGALFITVLLDNKKRLKQDPVITSSLLFSADDPMLEKIQIVIRDAIKTEMNGVSTISERIRLSVRRFLKERIEKNAKVYVHCIE